MEGRGKERVPLRAVQRLFENSTVGGESGFQERDWIVMLTGVQPCAAPRQATPTKSVVVVAVALPDFNSYRPWQPSYLPLCTHPVSWCTCPWSCSSHSLELECSQRTCSRCWDQKEGDTRQVQCRRQQPERQQSTIQPHQNPLALQARVVGNVRRHGAASVGLLARGGDEGEVALASAG